MEEKKTNMRTSFIIFSVLVIGVVFFLFTGFYDVSADKKNPSIVEGALDIISSQSINFHSRNITIPAPQGPLSYLFGTGIYISNCIICHGAPGINRSNISKGLNPSPPSLLKNDVAQDPKKTFWIIKHGIKMTGMPSFGKTSPDKELWDIVHFVNHLDSLNENDLKSLQPH